MTFKVQVEGYVGTVSDTNALDQWLTNAASLLTAILRPTDARRLAVPTATSSYTLAAAGKRIVAVTKDGYIARQIAPEMAGAAARTGSIHQATATDPVWYLSNDSVNVLPATSPEGYVHIVTPPTVLYSESSISKFPVELVPAVVLYAAIQFLLGKIRTDISTGLTAVDGSLDIDSIYSAFETAIGTGQEDIELALGKLTEADRKIAEYNAENSTNIQAAVTSVQAYNGVLASLVRQFGEVVGAYLKGGLE